MAKKKPELAPGETLIDSWFVNYLLDKGALATGYLHVTNENIFIQYEDLISGTMADAFSGNVENVSVKSLKDMEMTQIPKSDIANVENHSTFFKKRLILHLSGGKKITFGRGPRPVKKIQAALTQ